MNPYVFSGLREVQISQGLSHKRIDSLRENLAKTPAIVSKKTYPCTLILLIVKQRDCLCGHAAAWGNGLRQGVFDSVGHDGDHEGERHKVSRFQQGRRRLKPFTAL
jgi:hypothetical protein